MTAPLFWARFGTQLLGDLAVGEVVPVDGDAITVDRYGVGRVQGDLWGRVAEVSS